MTDVMIAIVSLIVGVAVGSLWGFRHDIRREWNGTAPAPEGWERVGRFTYRRLDP